MRIVMIAAVGMLAATAGMAHGERDNRKTWSVPENSATKPAKEMVVGVCQPVDVHAAGGGGAAFGIAAQQYLMRYAHKDPMDVDISKVQIKLIAVTQLPKHGRLIMRENDPYQRAKYLPDEGYYGKDRVEATVAVGKDVVRVVYNFVVQEMATDQIPPSMEKRLCPKGYMWKVSLPVTSR